MAVNYAVLLLLVLYSLLCRADDEGTNFTVSVAEDAKIGTDVLSLPRLLGTEKEELPCAMVEGDPYGRFYVSNNCTVTVARPLDWSVQSEYSLKLHVGGRQDPDIYIVRIRVNVRNVLGYPPVYNETCETPVNPRGNQTGEFLFSLSPSAEIETTAGDVLFFQKSISKPFEKWDMDNLKVIITGNDNCEVRIAFGIRNLNDLWAASEIWYGFYRGEDGTVTLSCHAETAMQSELLIVLYELDEHNVNKGSPYLEQLQVPIPQVLEKLQHPRAFSPIGCPPDRYGFLCDQSCICKNGARCHGFNGACKCTNAWQGVACDIPKPGVSAATTPSDPSDVYISANVTVHCKVHHVNATTLSLRLPDGSEIGRKSSSRLDQTLLNIQPKDNGPYKCQVWDTNGNIFNATVVLDIAKCPPNRKGEFCDETCDCLHGATCDWTSGCVCPAGWTGTRCQATCPNGTYGERCREKCRCRNGASCNPRDGRCTCAAGWYGWQCDVACPQYRHGLRCQQVCTCKNNATCHNVDGSCTCVAPWTGKNCDQVEQQEQAMRLEPLLEIFVPIGSFIVLAACVAAILYKKRHLCGVQAGQDDEIEAFLELEQVEADLAQTVRPGWLSRWRKTRRHLTLGPLVGMGMFGQVIQAKLKTPAGDITVAAKEVRRRDIQCYRNFYREAAILVAVHEDQHHDNLRSNIIQLLGFINEPTHKYILTEYASNGNLLRLLRQARRQGGPQSLPRHLRYAAHIARALQELQRLALTHRDVAARNVLITADHVAKLADFGQARDVYTAVQYVPNDKHGIEQPAKPKDNVKNEVFPLNWTALESLETGEYTCQSDVWSFGVLLWEIVTMGQEPRYHGNDQPTCQQLARTLRRGIRLRRSPECSGEMYDVMMSCWRESPPTRPGPDVVERKLVQLRNAIITVRETAV
ncbi:Endothelial cell-specific molecule 1 [Branchiostoma belcheri]|nr:Endothelial cell-specific molecule 1 [Branchiostoma belcheri]